MSAALPSQLDPRFAVFLSWAAARKARALGSERKRDQFSDKTQLIYESLWRGWVDWLGERDLHWQQATTAHVRAFLDGPAPAPDDRRRRTPIQPKKMANYTQQRYWSVLQDVYAHAVTNDLVEQSPCMDVARKPRISERSLQRQVMLPGLLNMLRDPARLAEFLPMKDERQWWIQRDRAAVALAAYCGLSTGELIALRGQDLRNGTSMLGPRQPQLPGVMGVPSRTVVDIPASKDRPPRSIPIPPEALKMLEPWLARRSELLQQQRAAFALGRLKMKPAEPVDAPVLLSREAPEGEPLPAVDPPTLWCSFRNCMNAALKAAGHELDGAYVARGPGILRNTVIADWAATLGAERAAALAGLKPASLRASVRR